MWNRILGDKNSVKRTIMSFTLCVMLVTTFFGAMSLFQSHMVARQYDEMLQNIVSIEESKALLEQIQLSSKKYAEVRNERDFVKLQTDWETLQEKLGVIEEVSRESSSLLAIESIHQLLDKINVHVLPLYYTQGVYDELVRADMRYEHVLYLLNRIQSLEVSYAAAIYPKLSQDMASLTKVAGITLVLMLLAAIAFSADFHAQVYAPIRHLVRGVREISRGNFQVPDIEISSNEELDYLASAVNGMKGDLQHLITTREEKLKAERLLKEAQLLALQSQVNPHFLFNALGMATAMALVEGADQTLDIIESISYMLRYSLQSMKTDVSLWDEIKMVKTYLFLQNQRFGDRIHFLVEWDERIPDVPIPGMTVQPIVENAVIHGCETLPSGGWLKVNCRLDAERNCAIVTVENNGNVISDRQIAAFDKGMNVPHCGKSTGIGLGNVRERIQYFYDREGLMDCAVLHGAVNRVTLRYPMDERNA